MSLTAALFVSWTRLGDCLLPILVQWDLPYRAGLLTLDQRLERHSLHLPLGDGQGSLSLGRRQGEDLGGEPGVSGGHQPGEVGVAVVKD